MVTVDCNNLYAGVLFKLFKSCGKLSVSLIFAVGGEVARKNEVLHSVLLGMLCNSDKSRFNQTYRLIRLSCNSCRDAFHKSFVVVSRK